VGLAYTFLLGLALGFSLTIPPGPMNALIASQTIRSLRAGVVTGVGAMSADFVLLVLVYGLHTVVNLASVVRYVYLVGAVVMVVFGCRLLLRPAEGPTEDTSGIRTYSQAIVGGLSNPFQVVWWLTAGVAFAYLGGVLLFLGLFAAIGVWVVSFPYALHLGTRKHPGLARGVLYASVGLMFAFAAYFVILAA
jgi:threonine/homoserine/homoserine lactone efflux protein